MDTKIACENSLSDIDELAVFGATTFRNDPLSVLWYGCKYEDNPKLWESGFRSTLQTIGEIGRVYTLRDIRDDGRRGKLIALATCYTPGHEATHRPLSADHQAELGKIAEAQRLWRDETDAQEEIAYALAYPEDFRRANMRLLDLSVAKEYRGKGYGSKLLDHVVKEAKALGAETLLEASKLDNVQYYEARGFRLAGQFDVHHFALGSLPNKFLLATGRDC